MYCMACFIGKKRPGCEANHSFPSSPEVKNERKYTSAPSVSLRGVKTQILPYTFLPLSLHLKAGLCVKTHESCLWSKYLFLEKHCSKTRMWYAFVQSTLHFPACFDPKQGVDIVVVKNVLRSSGTFYGCEDLYNVFPGLTLSCQVYG